MSRLRVGPITCVWEDATYVVSNPVWNVVGTAYREFIEDGKMNES